MNWLKGYWELEEEIATSEKKLKQLQGDPSIQILESFIEEKKNTKTELVELVSTFKWLGNVILKLKYIDGMTLENIAAHLGFSASYIYKKHAELMNTMKGEVN
ncbi:hypothetical protein PB01_08030 [Psychrobacillus glaciei]|uniref:DUF1492 domain-containing protein n=1 Tax=Psychrobacillus glaciei TaxID=2283160 RepID=A0A5J6SMW1_9BACI|nr:hypothetical protein [Psychrobacillus glaciei]QFF98783.1 hypothetical protein PB01_08030 [Psychrobacillus glaciei]